MEIRLTEQRPAFAISQDVEMNLILAGGGLVGRLEAHFGKTHPGDGQLPHLGLDPARVDVFGFERQTFEAPPPVPLLHYAADVHLVAGPINTALGEDECLELLTRNILDAVDVEARKVEF